MIWTRGDNIMPDNDKQAGESEGKLEQLELRMHLLADRNLHLIKTISHNAEALKKTCVTVQTNRMQLRSLWAQLDVKRQGNG
jgi:hypothetical protein